MKQTLLLLFCFATLSLASCKKETIVDSGLPNQTIETFITPDQWSSIESGTRLTTTINFPEIDDATFKNDAVLVYIYPNNAVGEYKQLPFVFDAQAYSYTARKGSITIDIQTSNDASLIPVKPTVDVGVRVVLVTSSLN